MNQETESSAHLNKRSTTPHVFKLTVRSTQPQSVLLLLKKSTATCFVSLQDYVENPPVCLCKEVSLYAALIGWAHLSARGLREVSRLKYVLIFKEWRFLSQALFSLSIFHFQAMLPLRQTVELRTADSISSLFHLVLCLRASSSLVFICQVGVESW